MIVCGKTFLAQFCEDYKKLNKDEIPFIKYPSKCNLDLSSINSISTFSHYSVIVYKDGSAFGIGCNNYGQIHSSLPKETLTELTPIKIVDSQNKPFKIISASCYDHRTLYLISDDKGKNKLFSSSFFHGSEFIENGDSNPIAIYNSAAINDDGSITIIYRDGYIKARRYLLPNDKAIKVANGYSAYFALGSKGNVYRLEYYQCEQNEFKREQGIIEEIVDIDGKNDICLAVSKRGTVYGCGQYANCQLGIDINIARMNPGLIKYFMQIDNLLEINVKAAFAGGQHSIFISDQNDAYCVGTNNDQLMLYNSNISKTYLPIKIEFSNVTFCIADAFSTILFIGNCSPKHSPNRKTTDIYNHHDDAFSELTILPLNKRMINSKEMEIKELQKEIQQRQSRIDQLLNEIDELKK